MGLSALALAFGVCCVAPWAVTILGVSGAVLLARLAFTQPYVVAGTIILLGVGFWSVYRRPGVAGSCDVTQRRRSRWIVWIAAVLVVVIDVASFAPLAAEQLRKAAGRAPGGDICAQRAAEWRRSAIAR